jgi:hypothetical protein
MYKLLIFALIYSCCSITAYSQSDNLKVVIIRHGEKPEKGDNLNCQGFNRSIELPKVLSAKFGMPSAIFIPEVGSGNKTKSCRMFQTISPFAIKNNLKINSNHDEDDYNDIVRDVKAHSGTVIMVWEHSAIPELANALGIKQQLKWKASDFDSIWIITYKNGTATLTKDREGLNPSANCSF